MDDIEDDARYPSKPYSLNPYNPPRRPRNPIRNAPFSHPIISNRYEIEEDDDDDDDENDVELEEDLDDEDDENPDGYYRNLEGDGEFVDRHSKKRKLRNSIPEFEFDFASVPRGSRSSKPLYSGADWNEHAVFVLLEVWGDRFLQWGRKSLRSEDWNDVAEKVSEASKMEKDELQCRTMLDKLKRKYKKEKAKVEDFGVSSSKWVYFKKMDMLMASSPRQECGLACGIDSGEYVFMNTRVYLERSNGFDEMRDSPGESENEEEEEEGNGLDERGGVRGCGGGGGGDGLSYKVLADSIQKFGEIYEKIESSKRQQMMELEKMRLEFQRELELQKKQILERAQVEIAKMQEEVEDDEDSDASEENVSE